MKKVYVLYCDDDFTGPNIISAFATRQNALEHLIANGWYLGNPDPETGFAYYLDEVSFEEAVK